MAQEAGKAPVVAEAHEVDTYRELFAPSDPLLPLKCGNAQVLQQESRTRQDWLTMAAAECRPPTTDAGQ